MTILCCSDIELQALQKLIARYGMQMQLIADQQAIPGSFWQAPEAGLIKNRLYIRGDTPVHSALHETCHYICMDDVRRINLHTDAGGRTAIEEDSVCYLQILLSTQIKEMGKHRMFQDMDEWGYSFRLGSAQAWFEQDAEDACTWLKQHNILDETGKVTGELRR